MPNYQWEFRPLSENQRLSSQRLNLLPDTCFWKSRLQNLFLYQDLWDVIGLDNRGIYIFAGPIGSGRHMAGNALIGELPALYGCDAAETAFLYMRAEDFPESMTAEDAANQVNAIFEAGEGAPECIIVFDAMDYYTHLQIVSNAIADCVEEHNIEIGNLIVICYIEDEAKLSYDLRSIGLVFRTNKPSERQRAQFLQENVEWEFPNFELPGQMIKAEISFDDISVEEIVAETDGFSYGELSLFVRYVRLSALSRVKNGGGLLFMPCDREAVLECVDIVKNKENNGSAQMVNIHQTVGGDQHNSATSVTDTRENRTSVLAGKSERSFAENMELIKMVTTSGETEN